MYRRMMRWEKRSLSAVGEVLRNSPSTWSTETLAGKSLPVFSVARKRSRARLTSDALETNSGRSPGTPYLSEEKLKPVVVKLSWPFTADRKVALASESSTSSAPISESRVLSSALKNCRLYENRCQA